MPMSKLVQRAGVLQKWAIPRKVEREARYGRRRRPPPDDGDGNGDDYDDHHRDDNTPDLIVISAIYFKEGALGLARLAQTTENGS
jgi:hypothetical protein